MPTFFSCYDLDSDPDCTDPVEFEASSSAAAAAESYASLHLEMDGGSVAKVRVVSDDGEEWIYNVKCRVEWSFDAVEAKRPTSKS